MRKLASKMRDEVEESEDNKVEIRRDDRTIAHFTIEFENYIGPIVTINNVSLMGKDHEVRHHKLQQPLILKK
jgi:hypothetical protein